MQASHPPLRFDRALLVHPLGYRADAARHDIARMANVMPPIGLAGLAAWLDREGVRTSIVDAYAQPEAAARIRERLLEDRPAFLGLSCTTSCFLDGARIFQLGRLHAGDGR